MILRLMHDEPMLDRLLDERLPIRAAQVIWAVRHESARTVDDVLARRTSALLLNAHVTIDMAPADRLCDQPARDLGPRLAHAILPIPGKRSSDWGYGWLPSSLPWSAQSSAA